MINNFFEISPKQQIKIRNLYFKWKRFIEIKSISFDDFISLQYQIDNLYENFNFCLFLQKCEVSTKKQ